MPRPTRAPPFRLCLRRRGAAIGLVAALVISSRAEAAPGLDGTRNLGMGGATRASATGTSAMLVNPANMSFTRQFLIDPMYQVHLENNSHGVGILAMDSLLNARAAVGLGYVATLGGPKISFTDERNFERTIGLLHQAHEVGLPIAINAVMGWLSFGLRPKFIHSSHRFVGPDNKNYSLHKDLNKFGLDLAMTVSLRSYVNVSVVGQNLVGATDPIVEVNLEPYKVLDGSIDRRRLSLLSDFPRTVAHGLAVFPTRSSGFSFNFDGMYDFTSFRHQEKYTRMVFSGGAEYAIKNIVPIRIGGYWDSRGRGKEDDRGFIAFGLGFVRTPEPGGIGYDLGIGFSRQVTGPFPETRLAINLGIRLHPK
jgi:hypothetical protein